ICLVDQFETIQEHSEQKQKQRGRSSSPLTTQKAKKQNTMQTVDISLTQQNMETPEPVVSMELDSSPSKKGKEKETLEDTPENTITTLDVDTCFNASENFLDKNTSS
ncbi:13674_t:CDS:2, partial [Funneliformis geosporum]